MCIRDSFHTEAKDLALHTGLDLGEVEGFGQNGVDGIAVTLTGAHAVAGNILEAVAGPDVHDAGLAQFFGQILADADAGLAVVDPELASLLVGAGQGQGITLFMGEEGEMCIRDSHQDRCL